MKLYKYKALNNQNIEHHIDILSEKNIFFCHGKLLNDPFEGQVIGDKKIENLFRNSRVASFAGSSDHLLMWSHYGGAHCGICYEFDKDKLSSSLQKSLLAGENYFTEGLVVYSKELPIVPEKKFEDYTATDFIFTKSDVWNYEEEYRFICSSLTPTRKLNFSNDSLETIFIGAHFPFGHPEYHSIWNAISELGNGVKVIVFKLSQEVYGVESRFEFNAGDIYKIIDENKYDLGLK